MSVGPDRRDIAIAAIAALTATAAIALDGNSHLAAENDIYMLRQVTALRELAPWRWEWGAPVDAAIQAAFWIANISFYFHGPFPPLLQAIFLDVAEAAFGLTGPGVYFASSGVFMILGAVAFVAALRIAGVERSVTLVCAVALCASPVWLALSRGFGASWLVSVVGSHLWVAIAAQRAIANKADGPALLAAALAYLLSSDVLAPLSICAIAVAASISDRGGLSSAKRILATRWILLPVGVAAWILASNIFVWMRGITHPSNFVLFAYPFAQYLVGVPGQESSIGHVGWSWAERARILILLFGAGILLALPAVVAGFARLSVARGSARALLATWAVFEFFGFGAIFLFVSGPSTGSQAMPLIGYPIYLLAPGATLIAIGLSELAHAGMRRLAVGSAMLWLAGASLSAWIYVWRVDLPRVADLLTVREGTDVVGFRYPDSGIMGGARVLRAAIAAIVASGEDRDVTVSAVLEPSSVGLRNVLFWHAGIIDGGAYQRAGAPCIPYVAVDTDGNVIERPAEGKAAMAAAMTARVASSCSAQICVGVGKADAPQTWRVDVLGDGGRSVVVQGFGNARPVGFEGTVRSADLVRSTPSSERGLQGAPIGYMGMERARRIAPPACGIGDGR